MFSQFFQNIKMAFEELQANKLRTFLSLLGVTIGVFCIVSILTVFDSLQNNIQNNMQTLGSNVLYIGKFPWIPEDKGEYQWWKYKARPICNLSELKKIQKNVTTASYATICYSDESQNLSYENNEIKGVNVFAVSYDFNKLQPIDIANGRYFSLSEMNSSHSNALVIGANVADDLFGNSISPDGKFIDVFGKKFQIIGVLKKQGKTMTGFDFDNGIIISYAYLSSIKNIDNNVGNGFIDPMIMVKAKKGVQLKDMKYEIKSVLRAERLLKPTDKDNFSFNQLDAIQNSIDSLFAIFKLGGGIIALFSMVVGCFGIANIMFVSVKERTNQIGIKKALGAKSNTILAEFLIEAITICVIGGLIGIFFVLILGKILSGPIGFPIKMSFNNFMIGILASVIVGIIAGILPAIRASKLNPVVAIRS